MVRLFELLSRLRHLGSDLSFSSLRLRMHHLFRTRTFLLLTSRINSQWTSKIRRPPAMSPRKPPLDSLLPDLLLLPCTRSRPLLPSKSPAVSTLDPSSSNLPSSKPPTRSLAIRARLPLAQTNSGRRRTGSELKREFDSRRVRHRRRSNRR